MRNTTKRLLSLVMVIALMLTLAPLSVFAAGTKTVYFQNNWMWSNVSVHYWGSSSSPDTTWPGAKMTKVGTEANYDVYKAEIPADVEGIVINGIKDDGSGNRDQTPDITNIQTGVCYYMIWDSNANKGVVGTFPYGDVEDPSTEPSSTPSSDPTTPVGPIDPPAPMDSIQDGATLHCWNWSFADIEKNMEKIAAQGYTAVQTSPIQQAKEATVGNGMKSHWWVFYQPANFYIDTTTGSALGTKAQFESMCETAHKYGVKVIVDVVANHLGNQTGNNLASTLDPDIKNDSSCWHDISKNTTNYNDRYDITQHCMAGLPDLNTSNKKIQNYALNFLKECIDAGADGFRFDGAKHIETPDDSNCGSDFWPYVINGATEYAASTRGIDLYCYGEVLDSPGGGLSISAYTKYMSVTDNSWGNSLRGAVNGGNAGGYNSSYHKGAKANQLVVWAESHDTYANDSHESTYISVSSINKTWALIAARTDVMGLYFARPANFDSAKLGQGDVTGWSYPEVKAANEFHNYFVGKSEYLANENGIAYCERGGAGVILVNCSGTSRSVNVKSNTLADGTYVDALTGNTFTVSGGRISGQIGSTGIAVVYQGQLPCQHTWKDATCTAPKTCSKCGETSGNALGHSWTDATCTAPKTCSVCGETEGTALSHSYVKGTCTVCGAADPDYKPVIDPFTISAAQAELGNALNLSFLFPVDAYADWTGCYAEVTKTYADGRDNVVITVPADQWEDKASGGVQYKKIGFHNISAKEMADSISIVVYNADGVAISNPYSDSIVSYLERMLGKNSNAEFRTLAVDMLNYGAAAQTQFNYNLDNLANANIGDYQQYGTATDAVCANNQVKGENVRGASVSLENNIIMNVYFEGQTADMTAEVTFKNHAGTDMTVELTSVETSNGYCFQIDTLAVADMRTAVRIVCYDGDGIIHGTLTDSVEGYVARTGATKAINQAIMKFSDSAYAYLH